MEAESLSSVTPKTSLRCWSHPRVILTASSQNNNWCHTRCRKKFKDLPSNQTLIAPNSCNLLHNQQGGSSLRETLLHHGDFFSFFFPSLLLPPSSGNKASTRFKLLKSWLPIPHYTEKIWCHFLPPPPPLPLSPTFLCINWHNKQVSTMHHTPHRTPLSIPGNINQHSPQADWYTHTPRNKTE
jgi:hypothetical protein